MQASLLSPKLSMLLQFMDALIILIFINYAIDKVKYKFLFEHSQYFDDCPYRLLSSTGLVAAVSGW